MTFKIFFSKKPTCDSLGNYANDQQSFGPRSYGNMGNDLNQQYQPPNDEFKRYMNQNIKQLI